MRKIVAVFLAAGNSSRMDMNKLLLPFRQDTIAGSSFQAAIRSQVDHILVITQKNDFLDWMKPKYKKPPYDHRWTQVVSDKAELGQAYSIISGIREAISMDASQVLMLLADQPLIQSSTINKLIKAMNELVEIDYVASSSNGQIQPPILFSSTMFNHLLKLNGDKGARVLLKSNAHFKGEIINVDSRNLYDIDTEGDYKWLQAKMMKQ